MFIQYTLIKSELINLSCVSSQRVAKLNKQKEIKLALVSLRLSCQTLPGSDSRDIHSLTPESDRETDLKPESLLKLHIYFIGWESP